MINSRTIHHVCIQTNNYNESLKFYTEILNFKLIKETKNFHNRDYNTWLQSDNFMIELQTPKNNIPFTEYSTLAQGIVHICFLVNNIKEEFAKIKSLGYNNFKIKNGREIYDVEGGYLFKLRAPEGTEIEFRDTLMI